MGKAFDNRAGLSVMIEAFKTLCREGHPNTLIAAATVQEEVGTRGAKTAGVAMRPDCVIVLEGPPADDTPGFYRGGFPGCPGRRRADQVV